MNNIEDKIEKIEEVDEVERQLQEALKNPTLVDPADMPVIKPTQETKKQKHILDYKKTIVSPGGTIEEKPAFKKEEIIPQFSTAEVVKKELNYPKSSIHPAVRNIVCIK